MLCWGHCRGGGLLLGDFCGRASAERGGPTRRGGPVTARGARCSGGLAPSAATQKTAGTCPGRRSPRCCSCPSPGWGLRAWAACPAGGGQGSHRAVGHPPAALRPTAACPVRGRPGSSPSPPGTLCRGLQRPRPRRLLLPGAPTPRGSAAAGHNRACLRQGPGVAGRARLAAGQHAQSAAEMQGERRAWGGGTGAFAARHSGDTTKPPTPRLPFRQAPPAPGVPQPVLSTPQSTRPAGKGNSTPVGVGTEARSLRLPPTPRPPQQSGL